MCIRDRAKGREEATGRGVGLLTHKLMKRLGSKPGESNVAIQGFGNVGTHAAKFLDEAQFPIVAVSDITGTYYRAAGLNVRALLKHKLEHPRGLLEGFDDCETLPPDALLGLVMWIF